MLRNDCSPEEGLRPRRRSALSRVPHGRPVLMKSEAEIRERLEKLKYYKDRWVNAIDPIMLLEWVLNES